MSPRPRVALVTPRPERLRSAGGWAPLLADRAELALCPGPGDARVDDADVVVLDGTTPDLDEWVMRATSSGRGPESIVVFDSRDPAAPAGAVPWGTEGAEVLATLSDLLERRRLLAESDEFVEDLRDSNDRLDEERRRFAGLVLAQADALRGANADLSREVDELRRLHALTRFFAAPGPEPTFADRLAEAAGRALGATGLALLHRVGDAWVPWGRWRIARRNALGIAPAGAGGRAPNGPLPSTRRDTDGWWVPIAAPAGARVGLAVLARAGTVPGADVGPGFLDSLRALLAEGLDARLRAEAARVRQSQSERMVQTLRGGVLRIDGDARVAFANPACEAILGRAPADLVGRPVAEVFPRDAQLRSFLERAAAGASAAADELETSVTRPDGRRVALSLRVSPLPDGGGDGVLVLLADLSRRQEIEVEMRRADRLASLGRLSAGVAHEIRNPLAGIRTTAELLRSRLDDRDDLGRFVDVILEETHRLDRIVGSLLEFAKPAEPRLAPVDAAALLERVSRLAQPRASERGVSLAVDAREAAEARPLADRDQILQVLLNLVLNAIDAAPDGGEVAIAARRRSGPGGADSLEVEVRDGGPGVPAHLRERVFDPFFTTKPGGTGLGLSISRNILRRHGGTLRLGTAPDGGTSAVAVLPLPGAPRASAPSPGDRAPHSQAGGDSWRTS